MIPPSENRKDIEDIEEIKQSDDANEVMHENKEDKKNTEKEENDDYDIEMNDIDIEMSDNQKKNTSTQKKINMKQEMDDEDEEKNIELPNEEVSPKKKRVQVYLKKKLDWDHRLENKQIYQKSGKNVEYDKFSYNNCWIGSGLLESPLYPTKYAEKHLYKIARLDSNEELRCINTLDIDPFQCTWDEIIQHKTKPGRQVLDVGKTNKLYSMEECIELRDNWMKNNSNVGTMSSEEYFHEAHTVGKYIVNKLEAKFNWPDNWSQRNKEKYFVQLDAVMKDDVDIGREYYEVFIKPFKKVTKGYDNNKKNNNNNNNNKNKQNKKSNININERKKNSNNNNEEEDNMDVDSEDEVIIDRWGEPSMDQEMLQYIGANDANDENDDNDHNDDDDALIGLPDKITPMDVNDNNNNNNNNNNIRYPRTISSKKKTSKKSVIRNEINYARTGSSRKRKAITIVRNKNDATSPPPAKKQRKPLIFDANAVDSPKKITEVTIEESHKNIATKENIKAMNEANNRAILQSKFGKNQSQKEGNFHAKVKQKALRRKPLTNQRLQEFNKQYTKSKDLVPQAPKLRTSLKENKTIYEKKLLNLEKKWEREDNKENKGKKKKKKRNQNHHHQSIKKK